MIAPALAAEALANCASEPIHIPGSIQPHGALLAVRTDGTLVAVSANAAALLGPLPAPGEPFGAAHLNAEIRAAISQFDPRTDDATLALTALLGGILFDVVLHKSERLVQVEFEPRGEHATPPFDFQAQLAQRAIGRICGARQIESMLQAAVEEIRRMTGFDRVMAYQFLHDESGEVTAESRHDDAEPFLGLRYPASDVPPQARLLYVANPIRMIVDSHYAAVPLLPDRNPLTGGPIDLSFSVLRSVSPVHLEYLRNMGVAASMSISIVVGGRLWGLLACHHTTPRLVPYAIRVSCTVLSDVVSAVVERHVAELRLRELKSVSVLSKTILRCAENATEMLNAFDQCPDAMLKIVDATGYAISVGGVCASYGETPATADILKLINDGHLLGSGELFAHHDFNESLAFSANNATRICGVMAICFETEQKGYVLWFRNEQIESVRWAGNPSKTVVTGPVSSRLMPRASFAEWQEQVHGQSLPWDDYVREIAAQLKNALQEIALAKSTRLRLEREKLWATLGHDLRMPLHSIMMLAGRLGLQATDPGQLEMTRRITMSSKRMDRLVSDVMDISKLQSGLQLRVDARPLDLNALIRDIVQETRLAHPMAMIEFSSTFSGAVYADADRLSQVLTNLLGNAIVHGEYGATVLVTSCKTDDAVVLTVSNRAKLLDQALLATIFSPYRSGVDAGGNNRQGLGLGLHIANEIVKSHSGSISIIQQDGLISFRVSIPDNAITLRQNQS